MQNVYVSKFGSRTKLFPTETGKAFWLKLTSVSLIDTTVADIYTCPERPELAKWGDTHYLGPGSNVNTLTNDAPVGCDDAVHPGTDGGTVLLKSGDVKEHLGRDWLRLSSHCAR